MTSKGSGFLGAGERAPCVTGHEGALHADRLVNKSSAQAGQTMIQAVWEASKGRPRSVGPVGRACRTVTNLGWRAIDRWWKWQLPDDPEPLDMVCEPVSKLMHRVQEALREQQLRQLELRRPRQFERMNPFAHHEGVLFAPSQDVMYFWYTTKDTIRGCNMPLPLPSTCGDHRAS